MRKAYVFRLYPNASQARRIDATIGCCRWVYNEALATRQKEYRATGKAPSRNALVKMIPGWKRDNPWLVEADAVALQQSVRDLQKAYDNYFRRVEAKQRPYGFPKFKKKDGPKQSYRTNNSSNGRAIAVIDSRHVKLPKLGAVRAKVSRDVEGRITSATVRRTPTGKYLVSILAELPEPPAAEYCEGQTEVTGVDMGVKALMTLSDGREFANPKCLKRRERALARAQRSLSRKKPGSRNRAKQRLRKARIEERIADARRDALQKATTEAVRESQAIAVEDLGVEGMKKNRKLSKAVSDASMGEALCMLEYKCAWAGKPFARVSRWYPSSKACSACGHVLAELPLSVREWDCPACGARHGRDLNAARNIAAEGARIMAEARRLAELENGNGTAGHAGTAAA